MKLACNYYRETEILVTEEKLAIDYYKFPAVHFQMPLVSDPNLAGLAPFARRLQETKPLLLHGLYPPPQDLSSPDFQQHFNRERTDRMLAVSGTPGLSMHPCAGAVDPARSARSLADTIAANLQFLVAQYGVNRIEVGTSAGKHAVPASPLAFVSVENLDHPQYGPLLEAEVIADIVDASGAALLLDISHAYCASFFTGVDFYAYLRKLPLSRVSEIHINGWFEQNGQIMSHLKINEAGYRALTWLLERCTPQIVTVEYGRASDRLGIGCPVMSPDTINHAAMDEIKEQVERIREIIG